MLATSLVALVVLVAGGTAAMAGGRIGDAVGGGVDSLARNLAGAVDRLRPAPAVPPVPEVLTSVPAGGAPVAPRGPVRTEVSTGTLGASLTADSDDGPVTVAGTLSPTAAAGPPGSRWTSRPPTTGRAAGY